MVHILPCDARERHRSSVTYPCSRPDEEPWLANRAQRNMQRFTRRAPEESPREP